VSPDGEVARIVAAGDDGLRELEADVVTLGNQGLRPAV
jgi:hypothetical protein